jgi:NAD-dependent deacetylase
MLTDRPRRLLIFTGAGISADSGIQTFRDANGLWEGHNVDQVANILHWRRNFETVHAFYNARRAQLREVEPNAAHRMIARLRARFPGTVNLTQNVDDLLERGGCTDVIHLHGSLTRMQCVACGNQWEIGYRAWDCESERCPLERCSSRKGVKPAIVFFHEAAPRYYDMHKAVNALQRGDVALVMGTLGNVIPIGAMLAETEATTVLSNLESATSTPQCLVNEDRQFDYVLHGRAAEMAERIEAHIVYLMERGPLSNA